MPRTSENTSSLARNSIEGYMVVHRKKKQRQRFLLSKSTHFVVANTMKHALEIYKCVSLCWQWLAPLALVAYKLFALCCVVFAFAAMRRGRSLCTCCRLRTQC